MNKIPMMMVREDLKEFVGNMPLAGSLVLERFDNSIEYEIDHIDNTVCLSINDMNLWVDRADIKTLRKLLKNLALELVL